MSTATFTIAAEDRPLPEGAEPIQRSGLLSRVTRPCPDHGSECHCVGRDAGEGCLVFWCREGGHHYTVR